MVVLCEKTIYLGLNLSHTFFFSPRPKLVYSDAPPTSWYNNILDDDDKDEACRRIRVSRLYACPGRVDVDKTVEIVKHVVFWHETRGGSSDVNFISV